MARPKIEETEEDIRQRQRTAVLVRLLRTALGLNQRELSERIGLSFSGVAKLENGTMRLNPEKLKEIFAFFDEAGLQYAHKRGKISVSIPQQTLDVLCDHDLTWPLYD